MFIKDIYGTFGLQEPLMTIIKSPALQRLKRVWTGGIARFFGDNGVDFSRYSHSIGVLLLLIKYGANTKEQIAGLLHDVSHTAFSHVTEHLFKGKGTQDSYQDEIHAWFLHEMLVDELLQKYGFSVDEVFHESKSEFLRLEQPLPDICADRLEYNLHAAYLTKQINKRGLERILNSLKFEDGKWFFVDERTALDFAQIPLILMQDIWASPQGMLRYRWLANALKVGVDEGIITFKDIHFSSDAVILKKLKARNNQVIAKYFAQINNPSKYFKLSEPESCDQVLKGKFRGIDPLLRIDGCLVRLTDVNPKFKSEFERVRKSIEAGSCVKFIN